MIGVRTLFDIFFDYIARLNGFRPGILHVNGLRKFSGGRQMLQKC